MLGNLAGDFGIRVTFNADEGDPVGAGDTTEAHSSEPSGASTCPANVRKPPPRGGASAGRHARSR